MLPDLADLANLPALAELFGGGPVIPGARLSWWTLAALFAVTEACVVQVRLRRRTRNLTLSQVLLVLGLFLADPGALLLARALGGVAALGLSRRRASVRAGLELAAAVAGAAVAALGFQLVLSDAAPLGWRGWLAAVVAPCVGGLVPLVARERLRRLDRDWRRPRPAVVAVRSLSMSAASGAVGLALLLGAGRSGQGRGVLAVVLLTAAGLVCYRAFARLAQRHASLERLYELSDRLAAAPGSPDVVRSVLEQSTTLLRAGYAEVMLTGAGSGLQLWSLRAGGRVRGPVQPGRQHRTLPFPPGAAQLLAPGSRRRAEREFLAARSLREAVLVPIRIDGPVTGQLLVGDRAGEDGGFTPADLRLLETVANHASVALRNGRLIERLHGEARTDELTGLPNRLRFRGLLDDAAEALQRGVGCAVMVLDFNGFKAINDTLGHQAGDQLLQVLAGRFAAAVEGVATVARLGGDEFAVLARGVDDAAAATGIAERVLSAFDEPVEVGGKRLRVGGSLGIALGPQHGRSGPELLRMADVAMYVAKSGIGGVRVYSPEFAPQSSEVLTLATDLRDALQNGEIEIMVQPLVGLERLGVHSLEALARWRHPVLGEISPAEFFAAAERAGLTAALSTRVLDRALAACRSWRDAGHELRISVNMATRWLTEPAVVSQVAQALERHGVPARLLCLEITETGMLDDPTGCVEVLGALRELGVRIAVDDFGTGYSSLTWLSRLPIDQIKLDRSFVEPVAASPRDAAIVRSIVDLGHNLGLEVVAEGITDPATRRALRELGCEYGQGFLFARPIPIHEVPPLLDRIRTVGWPLPPRPPRPATARPVPAPVMVPGWQRRTGTGSRV